MRGRRIVAEMEIEVSVPAITRWGLMWRSEDRLDGKDRHLICEHCLPKLFRTRSEARAFADQHYGYIKTRHDLRKAYGWRMPVPVRVKVELQ